MISRKWKPLLDGARAEAARRSVAEIGAALRYSPETDPHDGDDAVRALFFAYAADVVEDRASFESEADKWLEWSIRRMVERPVRPALYGGTCGTSWVVEHLAGVEDGEDDPLATPDASLVRLLSEQVTADFDLIWGLVGFGVYGLERSPRASGRAIVSAVIDQLESLAIRDNTGTRWHTAPQQLPPWQRVFAPAGYFNLGLAHGNPGVVGFLARCVAHGVVAERAASLLDSAMMWLLAQRRDVRDGSWFGCWAGTVDGEGEGDARAAWCYGDPGVAAAVAVAAMAAGRSDWSVFARDLTAAIAARAPDRCGVRDAGLCHGAIGLAHVLARLYQATGVDTARIAAAKWYERALAMREVGRGLAGYLAYSPAEADVSDQDAYKADRSLLTGVSGIGLALVAAVNETPPDWDRLLLVDIPADCAP